MYINQKPIGQLVPRDHSSRTWSTRWYRTIHYKHGFGWINMFNSVQTNILLWNIEAIQELSVHCI